MQRALLLLGLLATLITPSMAQDPTVESRLQRLESENDRFERALRRSEERNERLEKQVARLRTTAKENQRTFRGEALELQINSLAAQADEGWSRATRTGTALRFYGFLRLDAYYNTARMTDPVKPFAVLPENSGFGRNNNQFALDARLTRIGFEFDAGKIGRAHTTALIETDFGNSPLGTSESRETPRIRLAYANFDFGDVTIRIGQDWDVISPLCPSVNSEMCNWGAGNIGDRRPQIQFTWAPDDEGGANFGFEASLGLTGAVDSADNDGIGGRTNFDGFDSGLPQFQARVFCSFDSWATDRRGTIGVWGLISSLETDMPFGGETEFTPFAIGMDMILPLTADFTLRGEAWYGQALADSRGNMFQDINTLTGEEISGWGGFAELAWQVADDLRLTFGTSLDNPDDSNLNSGLAGENRALNWTSYVATQYSFNENLRMGLDVAYWESHWAGVGMGNAIRINWYTQLDF